MSAKLDAATTELARLKAIYQHGLGQVDRLLESAVARDPSELSAARAIQNQYVTGVTAEARLAPAMQQPFTAFELVQISDTITAVLV